MYMYYHCEQSRGNYPNEHVLALAVSLFTNPKSKLASALKPAKTNLAGLLMLLESVYHSSCPVNHLL